MSIIVSVCVRIDTESFVEAEVLSVFALDGEGFLFDLGLLLDLGFA